MNFPLIRYARACRNYADFLFRVRFLTIRLLEQVMLLQDWSPHYRRFMVVIMNSWIVTMCPSAPWKPICSTCHNFLSSFVYPGLVCLWATRRVFLEKQRTLTLPVQLVHAPSFMLGPSCSFTFVTFYALFQLRYVLCCVGLFSMSGLCPCMDYILLISARILVPLITL